MVVDGDSENITSGLVDDTEAVSLARDDVRHSERNSRSALEAASTIDSARIGDRNNSSRFIRSEQWESTILPPIALKWV